MSRLADLSKSKPAAGASVREHAAHVDATKAARAGIADDIARVEQERLAAANDLPQFTRLCKQLDALRAELEGVLAMQQAAEMAHADAQSAAAARRQAEQDAEYDAADADELAHAEAIQEKLAELGELLEKLVSAQKRKQRAAGGKRFAVKASTDQRNERFVPALIAAVPKDFSGVLPIAHYAFPWRAGQTEESMSFAHAFRPRQDAPHGAADDAPEPEAA